MERHARKALRPVRKQLRDARHVHVWLHERVVQALVRDVHLGDSHDVINVGHDRDALVWYEDDGAIAGPSDVQDARLDNLYRARVVATQAGNGDELVELANIIGGRELDAGRVGNSRAVGEDKCSKVRLGDRNRGEVLRTVLEKLLLG